MGSAEWHDRPPHGDYLPATPLNVGSSLSFFTAASAVTSPSLMTFTGTSPATSFAMRL